MLYADVGHKWLFKQSPSVKTFLMQPVQKVTLPLDEKKYPFLKFWSQGHVICVWY